jgi:DNA-binding response OmpR family regulator
METSPRRHVLIIEDEDPIRAFFAKALNMAGYAAHEASTAEAALALIRDGLVPDAVLLDLSMPGIGGLGFLLQVRLNPRLSMPIAIVTGHFVVDDAVRIAANELGVSIHHKPIDMEQLLMLVEGLFGPTTRA